MGRKRKEIDKTEFEKLCALQCTYDEICSWFGVSDKTLNNWCRSTYKASFSEVFREKRGMGKISLRRNQFKLSETNASMAIWLGKQYLGQKDQVESSNDSLKKLDSLLKEFRDAVKPEAN